ncbi:small nucleolar ribonucleoprotein-like protein complex subunit [Sporormia fimetaria CBS 119925]|uniref:Small nucleolar ribonucleoprotein-like protein complex subunit n=1 Tax=Sporormia fimetaria CBS 119925 TaxID=1340428 RepID=A0A6A6VEC3_9PLEO|nr:small nucleolar ribonucleoprotein-like protein complex subunit [Sporormia fimetaria CBS 119925]
MDIHRSRFVPYPPSAINALAFSHSQPDNDKTDPGCLRLALGRANGNIEIWNPAKGSWVQERVFPGGRERSVEGLVWTQEPDETTPDGKRVPGRLRLFSIGYSNSVTEWDLRTGLPARHSSGNHSEVWCFAAQPRAKPRKDGKADASSYQKIVAGCADGTVVLLSTADDDVKFERFLSRSFTKKARVLSIAYKDQNTVLAGYADSTIRVMDSRNGNVLRNISLGSGPIGGPKEILVWKVKCFPNGDFVSGDSTGEIRIYDGKNYSQVQRISGHEADVLDLAVSQDGAMIFSGGMDRRTCFYSCSKKKGNRGEKWRKVSHQRYHDHDVKAMATYEGHHLNMIVSGGIDTKPIVLPMRQFGKEHSKSLPSLPQQPLLVSAPDARLMASWWDTQIRIWRVKSKEEGSEKPKVVARLALQGQENITSVSMSRDGQLLAAATAAEVKLFCISPSGAETGPLFRIRKVEMPVTAGAKLVRIAPSGKWLAIVTMSDDVEYVRIVPGDDVERPRALSEALHVQRLPRDTKVQDSLNGPWGEYNRAITHAEFSTDSNVFAVADVAGYIDSWIVQGHEDPTAPEIDIAEPASSPSMAEDESDSEDEEEQSKKVVTMLGQRWIRNPSAQRLPKLDSSPLLLSFQPSPEDSTRAEPNGNPAVHPTRNNRHPHSHDLPETEQQLLVVSAKHELHFFDILAGRLSGWSRRNPSSSYPLQFRRIDDLAKGCVWDVADNNQRLWLYGENWLFMFDLSRDLPVGESQELVKADATPGSKKRKRDLKEKERLRKSFSGAGDAVSATEAPVSKLRKFNSSAIDDMGKATWMDLGASRRHGASSDEEDEDEKHASLVSLRRSETLDGEDAAGTGDEGSRRESWWLSFKYRPILGIVSVSKVDEPLEVVLVERPSWEVDLPPRFVGSHE